MKYIFKIVISLIFLVICQELAIAESNRQQFVYQSERKIPVVKSVDVVIIGGTVPAVSAAVSAARNGAEVFLIAPRPFLGEDLCATLRIKIDNNQDLNSELGKKLFGNKKQITPLKVKAVLNQALTDEKVGFVFGTFVTDILWGDSDNPAGVIIANRSGRQAVAAKIIIDATHQGWIARMAGAKSEKWDGDDLEFERTNILQGSTKEEPVYKTISLKIDMPDLHFLSFAHAEQTARKETYSEKLIRGAESLFYIPPNPVICQKNASDWTDTGASDIEFFQPEGIENIFVLSGSAGMPRSAAASLLKPTALCKTGEIIGKKAATIAKNKQHPENFSFKNEATLKQTKGDIKEVLNGLRPVDYNLSKINFPETKVPVISEYDIVVVGGGTSGAPAAISAARLGMNVLVVEYQEGLGGVGTLGLIGKPYHGRDVGFAAEVPFPKDNIEPKMEWYRSEIEKAGGDIWLGVLGCGAYLEGNRVNGAVIATPEGRFVVKARVVIDATGNADVAIDAGAEYMYGEIENGDIALQGTGLPTRPLSGNYMNTDYLLVDETDMVDVWRTLVSVYHTKYMEENFDAGTLIQNRERHRVVGDFVMHYLDQITGRTFPDAIVLSGSDYDSHGYPSSEYFALLPHDSISKKQNHPAPGGTCYTPYRALLPKNLEGILVTGLAISMERDASAMVRMQLDMANQGYAAGMAATLAITSDKNLRDINVRELQQYLVEKGNLPQEVLTQNDSYPLSKKVIQQAVIDYGNATNPKEAGKPLAIILTQKDIALTLVEKAFEKSSGTKKLHYAEVLGMCGKKDGVPTLLAALKNFSGWDAKIYQGSMADFAHLPTPTDAIILALGNSGDKNAIPVLINLVEKLDTTVTLSHHRSLALALEKLADPATAKALAELLEKPGMSGHAMLTLDDALTELGNNGKGPNPVKNSSLKKRTRALREIVLARALYNCGDYNNKGKKILETYKNDMRGLFAKHAYQVLQKEKQIAVR